MAISPTSLFVCLFIIFELSFYHFVQIAAVQKTVGGGFEQVSGTDVHGALEVGDGAGDLDDAEVGAHREAHLGHEPLQHFPAGFAQRAEAFDLLDAHLRVGGGGVRLEAVLLPDACLQHPRRNDLARFRLLRPPDAFGGHGVHPDMDVYTIKNN